jgi:pyrroloquinoline quinone biosynthesis protein B
MKIMKKICFIILLCTSINSFADAHLPYLLILGVAQDAGYPQTACYQTHCMPGWENPRLKRGAVSLGLVSPKDKKKYLFEATPNLPQQLYQLEKQAPSEQYTLDGIFLTHAHIGHYTGLMFLGHEAAGTKNMPVYAMPRMTQFLQQNGPWQQLVNYNNILLKPLQHQSAVALSSLKVIPFLVPHRDEYSETVGFKIIGPNKSAIFIPDINKWSQWNVSLVEEIAAVDYALIDATFYADGELPGRDMSKIPHPFVSETMATLKNISQTEKNKVWFIHMNHTNPLLDLKSDESQYVKAQGFNIASEGIKLDL